MILVAVLFGATARAFCEIDSRVLWGMQFGVLVWGAGGFAIWGLCRSLIFFPAWSFGAFPIGS